MHEVRFRLHITVHHVLGAVDLSHGPRRQHLHLVILRVQVLLTDLIRVEVAARHGGVQRCLCLRLLED